MAETTYDSRQPLECCEMPHLKRQLGVRVSEPFQHGGQGDAKYVDIDYETPSVNTMTYGRPYPVGEWRGTAADMTRRIISQIDTIIFELQQHRIWLNKQVCELEQEAKS